MSKAPDPFQTTLPQPRRNDGGEPCGECHVKAGETCDICGAVGKAVPTATTPYDRSAMFRCEQGHGRWRRDQLPTRRGSLACPVGLPRGLVCGLKWEDMSDAEAE